METNVYAKKNENKVNPLYDKIGNVKHIRNIIEDSPLVTRIIFDQGEIELRASETELKIYSKSYATGETSTPITKQLMKGYNPREALLRAKNDISQRVYNLETEVLTRGVNEYLAKYFDALRKKQASKILALSDDEKRKIVEQYLNSAGKAA